MPRVLERQVGDSVPASPESPPGLTHKITIVRGQGRQGVYAEDRSIRVLG